MEVKVLDINGKETGRTIELSDSVFGIEPNQHAIYLDVKRYLAAQRQGTHKSKERGEIPVQPEKSKNKKVLVLHVQDQSKTLCSEVEVEFSDHVQEIIQSN